MSTEEQMHRDLRDPGSPAYWDPYDSDDDIAGDCRALEKLAMIFVGALAVGVFGLGLLVYALLGYPGL